MPKVKEAHAERRRQQILRAAQECFAARGFHQTSMQELCHCAGLSPGAVYSYFRSKEELIEAMYEERRRQNAALIRGAFAKDDTLEAFDELTAFFALFEAPGAAEVCRLDVELWAESLRGSRINESFVRNLATVRSLLAEVIRKAQERGDVDEVLDPDGAARVVMAFFEGLILQKAIEPALDASGYVAAMKAMMSGTFWRGNDTAAAEGCAQPLSVSADGGKTNI